MRTPHHDPDLIAASGTERDAPERRCVLSGAHDARDALLRLALSPDGVIVPDIVLKHRKKKREVFIEVLGYWSRDAVWKRIELAQRGLQAPIVFCAGQRLRVSEAALDENTHASLYVYKGVISASQVMERVDRLLG